MRWFGPTVAVVAMMMATTARAAPRGAVTVRVEPGAHCLDENAFARGVFARITRPRGEGRDDETRVSARIEAKDTAFEGTLRVESPEAPSRTRKVRGRTCEEVAQSLELVAVLALEGHEVPFEPPPADRPGLADEPTPAPPPLPARRTYEASAGLHGTVEAAGGPSPTFGGDAFADVLATGGLRYGLRLAVGAARTMRTSTGVTVATAPLSARLEPSLEAVTFGPVEVRAAAVVEGGVVLAEISRGATGDGATRPWLRVGPVARGLLRTAGPTLEVELGLMFPLVRDEFVVVGGPSFEVPAVSAFARVGVALPFLR